MYDFIDPFRLANTMLKSFNDAATGMMQQSLAMWAPPPKPDPAKSWYRAPQTAAFDWTAWALPFAAPQTSAWNFLATPFAPSSNGATAQGWTNLASFAQTMAALQPIQNFWMSMIPTGQASPAASWQAMMWPLGQVGMMMAAGQPNSYSAYRSDGGHATAQILFPGQTQPGWNVRRLH